MALKSLEKNKLSQDTLWGRIYLFFFFNQTTPNFTLIVYDSRFDQESENLLEANI